MPSTVKHFLKNKWPFVSAAVGLVALVAVSLPSFEAVPDATSERETTLASMSKAGAPVAVSVSPSLAQTSTSPVTLTATIATTTDADRINVAWDLPAGVTVSSGQLSQVIDHLDAGQQTTVSISVLIENTAAKPILVNALFARGSMTVGNGAHISVNQAAAVSNKKRMRFQSTGDERIFE